YRERSTQSNSVPFSFVDFASGPLGPRPLSLGVGLGNMGPELTFGRAMDAAGVRCGVAKIAVGNSDLYHQWHPDDPQTSYLLGPNLFTQAIQFLKETERGMRGVLSGVVWVQGSSDATNNTYAPAYQANLTRLIQ